jgi:hypothetical protein
VTAEPRRSIQKSGAPPPSPDIRKECEPLRLEGLPPPWVHLGPRLVPAIVCAPRACPFALSGSSVGQQRGTLRSIHLLSCTYNTSYVRILVLFNIFLRPSRSSASSCHSSSTPSSLSHGLTLYPLHASLRSTASSATTAAASNLSSSKLAPVVPRWGACLSTERPFCNSIPRPRAVAGGGPAFHTTPAQLLATVYKYTPP